MMRRAGVRRFLVVLFLAMPGAAYAFPVASPFGDFPKAIVFTGPGKPLEADSIVVADGDASSVTYLPGVILSPLGDGSWAAVATVFPGTYQYYFEFRIPEFEPDSTASFLTSEPGGARNQDANRVRTVTIPDTAGDFYVVYNAYGDRSVWGTQGAGAGDTTKLALTNPFLAKWRGTDLLTATDGDTSGKDESKVFNVAAKQISATGARVTFEYSIGGDGFAPHVEGANRFGAGASPYPYGFEILRADSDPNLPLTALDFTPVSPGWYADDDTNPWNRQIAFQDTVPGARADSVFVYTAVYRTAYGVGDTIADQASFTGGWDEVHWTDLAVEVDGAVDPIYGLPIGDDPAGDRTDFPNLDLTKLWVTRDAVYHYFAFRVNADVEATPWGYYLIFLDTTGDSSGAPDFRGAPAGAARDVDFPGKRPEYAVALYATNTASGPPVDASRLLRWNGSGWDDLGEADLVAHTASSDSSVVEVAVESSRIGSPSRIWVEAGSTGNGTSDPVLDTINRLEGEAENDEWNGGFSDKPSVLAVSTPFPPPVPPPAGVTAIHFDTRVFVRFREAPVNPALVERYDVFLSTDRSAVEAGLDTARVGSLSPSTLQFETSVGVWGETYWVRVFTVGDGTGETAPSNLAYAAPETWGRPVVATRIDSNGVTRIEVPPNSWDASETGFTVEILVYDEIWEAAQIDTRQKAVLDAIHTANERLFFDPTRTLVTPVSFPDTFSTVRQVFVRLLDGTVAPKGFFRDTVSFAVPYKTKADGRTLEGTATDESRLTVVKLDEAAEEWRVPSGVVKEKVDAGGDRVVLITTEFSVWMLVAGPGSITNFDQLVVYPNPFNERDYFAAGHPPPAHVTFAYLPLATDRIEIYNVAGERVRTLNREDGGEFTLGESSLVAMWDARNDYGHKVASGVYIFWAHTADGQTKVGKVAVIK